MRELLTPALATANPKAYIAHFRRLEPDAQRHYLQGLEVADLRAHFQTLGEVATLGLRLWVEPGGPRLEAALGGAALGEAIGPACTALQDRALALVQALEPRAISGLLSGSLMNLEALESALSLLGWSARTVLLAGDSGGADCAPSLGWALRGTIGDGGTFYMPNEALLWVEREEVQARLAALAQRLDAVLDVRLG